VPTPSEQRRSVLGRTFGRSLSRHTNDGFVPTLSQLHGELVHAAKADHLDMRGYFRQSGDDRHVDWLASGSGFRRTDFDGLWRSVASFIARR